MFGNAVRHGLPKWAHALHTHISNTSNRAPVLSKWALAPQTSSKTLIEIVERDDCASDIPHCVRSRLSQWPLVIRPSLSKTLFEMSTSTSNKLSTHCLNFTLGMGAGTSDRYHCRSHSAKNTQWKEVENSKECFHCYIYRMHVMNKILLLYIVIYCSTL